MNNAVNNRDDLRSLPPLGDIPLQMARRVRGIARGPAGRSVGQIILGAWYVIPVPRLPADLAGNRAYLIRIPYDLDFVPDGPGPRWLEVAFRFCTDGAMVHAALPHLAAPGDQARDYALNAQLTFTAQDQRTADPVLPGIDLPATTATVQVSGIGSEEVRWRHIAAADATVPAGSRIGWIVLLLPQDDAGAIPSGPRELMVCATAGFGAPAGRLRGTAEEAIDDAFTISLPEREAVAAHRATADGPRVFVSYAHDSDQHKADVAALCRLLGAAGLNVTFDGEPGRRRRDWQRWMTTGINRADYVIVVASPDYRAISEFAYDENTRRGVLEEYRLLLTLLGEDRRRWLGRILPVVLPGRVLRDIPIALQPLDVDHYRVTSLTPDGIAELVGSIGQDEADGARA